MKKGRWMWWFGGLAAVVIALGATIATHKPPAPSEGFSFLNGLKPDRDMRNELGWLADLPYTGIVVLEQGPARYERYQEFTVHQDLGKILPLAVAEARRRGGQGIGQDRDGGQTWICPSDGIEISFGRANKHRDWTGFSVRQQRKEDFLGLARRVLKRGIEIATFHQKPKFDPTD